MKMARALALGTMKRGVLARFFDQASGTWAVTDATAPTIRITPYKHYAGKWAWFAIRSKAWAGKTPVFLVAKADHYNLAAGEWLACWATSPDTDTWTRFDNVTIGATDIEFSHNSAFPSGTIYVSALPMYPYSRVTRRVYALAANALVGETTSTTNKIIDYMTARDANDGSGRTAPSLPIYGMKVANAVANTKNKAVLSSMQHPSESPGAFALEGALDWLLTAGVMQDFLLDWFEFYVYPCRNPQGVWAGFFRVQPQNKVAGANWTTTGEWETVDLMKPAIVADIDSTADVMLDYHSWMDASDISGVVVNGDTTGQYPIFAAAMETLDAAFELAEAAAGGEDGTLGKLLRDTYGVDLYATIEQHGGTARGITEWKAYGANTLKALATMLMQGNFPQGPGVGSRDFTAATNRIDWASAANLTGSATTIAFWLKVDTIPANGYIVCIHDAGDASFGIMVNISDAANGYIGMLVNGATDLQRSSAAGAVTTGAWIQFTVTWTGAINSYAGVHIYKNGTELSYSINTNGATETTHSGSWSLGGRIYDDTRNLADGKIAQVGVWNRVLTAGEIASLAAGYAPDLAAASGLQFYFKGKTASLTATPGGDGTADGTTQLTGVGTGPTIIY